MATIQMWRFFADALPLVVSNGGWTDRSSPATICYPARTSFHQYPSAGSDLADPHPDLTGALLEQVHLRTVDTPPMERTVFLAGKSNI
jgi:hypothetical protein